MNDNEAIPSSTPQRPQPWNTGKPIGAKPPLRASHVWSIRTKLQLEGRNPDLALFNLAIDSKLGGCDVVAVRVDDVAPNRLIAPTRSRTADLPLWIRSEYVILCRHHRMAREPALGTAWIKCGRLKSIGRRIIIP